MGKKAEIVSRRPLSLGDIFTLYGAPLPISPAEAMELFREALTMLRALQGEQGLLVTLPAARNAGIYYCSSTKHNSFWRQEPRLTTPLFLMRALSCGPPALQPFCFFVFMLSLHLINFGLAEGIQKERGCSSRISGCRGNRTCGFEFSQVENQM